MIFSLRQRRAADKSVRADPGAVKRDLAGAKSGDGQRGQFARLESDKAQSTYGVQFEQLREAATTMIRVF